MTTITINTDDHIVGFRGRQNPEDDPGATTTDPRLPSKLCKILQLRGSQDRIIHPRSDHSGNIAHICPHTALDKLVTIVSGDAFIIYPNSHGSRLHGAIRTRDCVPVIGYTDDNIIFGMHISNQTGFGYNPEKPFPGSLIQRMFEHIPALHCHIFIGPSIGGIVDGCECYEYTETIHKRDGTRLIRQIQSLYPQVDLDGLLTCYTNKDKLTIRWGELILKIFKFHGVPPQYIHLDHNHCTLCHADKWYSDRYLQHSSDPHNQELYQRRLNNLAWISPTSPR